MATMQASSARVRRDGGRARVTSRLDTRASIVGWAPSADGKDGLLVGVYAQQKAESLQKRSLRRQELLASRGNSV